MFEPTSTLPASSTITTHRQVIHTRPALRQRRTGGRVKMMKIAAALFSAKNTREKKGVFF
jgi:hypothetical protein